MISCRGLPGVVLFWVWWATYRRLLMLVLSLSACNSTLLVSLANVGAGATHAQLFCAGLRRGQWVGLSLIGLGARLGHCCSSWQIYKVVHARCQ